MISSALHPMPAAIRVRGLVKRFGDVVAVDGLDLEVRVGECFGLLGPNGAGKTTTLEILEGLQPTSSGDVELLGLDWRHHAAALRQRIGVALQETRLEEKLTVRETLTLFRSFYASGPTVEALLGAVQLEEKGAAWVGKLSGGQRQRLAVACGLAGDPELLFLDEPTSGLDPQSRRSLWELVSAFRARGRTVLLTTHYMDEAERLCDRVAVVDHGKVIAQGTPAALIGSLGGGHVIELSTEPGLPAEAFVDLPSVKGTRQGALSLELRVDEPHVTLPALLARLSARGARLSRLTTRGATLEDVFVSLTGRQLRDG
ncbi:MAG: ABC transporter ATP-binding protein [Deltaproteobacteria bacterium]